MVERQKFLRSAKNTRQQLNNTSSKKPLITDYDIVNLSNIPNKERPTLDFVLPGLLSRSVGFLVAAGGQGKSFLLLQIAASLAAGRNHFEFFGGAEIQAGRVVYVGLEDPPEIVQERLHSIYTNMPDDWSKIAENLNIISLVGKPFNIAHESGRRSDAFKELQEWISQSEAAPKLIIIDTFNRALNGISENDAAAMGMVLRHIESLALQTGAAVLISHHVSKASESGSVDSIRGSSALAANARWMATLRPLKEKELRERNLEQVDEGDIMQLEIPKSNYGQKPENSILTRDNNGLLHSVGAEKAEKELIW